jgi:hypothetical protein
MKLRIHDNSVRFRLTRKDVVQLNLHGWVEGSAELSEDRPFVYRLESDRSAEAVTAAFDGWTIIVKVPGSMVRTWTESDQVAIAGRSKAGVALLIEKDFQCLHQDIEQDPDAYPHPGDPKT